MKEQTPKGGRIVNIGSVSAKTPRPDSLPYTVTKFGLQGMTHQLTMDGRKHNIVASIIHPGATLSAFSAKRGRFRAGWGDNPGDDYIMAVEDVARVALLMAALPDEVNLYEATILPNPNEELHRQRLAEELCTHPFRAEHWLVVMETGDIPTRMQRAHTG